MALNKVMLIGNVGKKPEIRYLENPGGATPAPKIANFTLATTERYRDRSGEMRENTEWHNIVAWRQLADLAENYISTGTQIYVEGHLRSRSWEGQDGQKRYTTEIIADSIQLLGKKGDNPAANEAAGRTAAATQPQAPKPAINIGVGAAPAEPATAAEDETDDLPF